MATRVHVGISVSGLARLIHQNQVKPDVVTRDGIDAASKKEAEQWLRELLATGKTTMSECPAPLPNGACPGHQVETEVKQ